MFIQRLRRRLFGFKKADVYAFITEMDEKAAEKIAEKDKEIEELKAKVAELEANRDAVISALQIADQKAKEIVAEAHDRADTMRKEAEEDIQAKKEAFETEVKEQKEALSLEIREQKNTVNREIEIKRKAINNYYASENKKIDQIKGEVERMRKASMDAIQNFERQLREVERLTENSSSYLESAMNYAQTGSALETFNDVDAEIPVHIIESISE